MIALGIYLSIIALLPTMAHAYFITGQDYERQYKQTRITRSPFYKST